MSRRQKTRCAAIICLIFIFSVSAAWAARPTGAVSDQGASTGQKITKSSQFVNKITDSTLYLEGNQSYDLSGVNVIDTTANSRVSNNRKLAEMTFVNGKLKEVILR
ncbi:MAG TPA: hypothetical protein VLZ07_00995 [Syntrophales bacterium]|nr:hypothetical protein [Syntrophales bacterium]